ncbi:MAG: indolepyruvate ferredoxin oxidoreductase subunit alpha [candidate division WOR-3 bacterium]
MSRKLLTGNEAIAQGAWEAGCKVAAGYPGTPSTEILEALVNCQDVYCEWSANEKVAFEVGLGAASAGVRSLVTMKHVGLNVAADPLFSAAYIGIRAGMVVVSADDPGMHSSQNEQDNRWYGLAAKIPVLAPRHRQAAKDLTKLAYAIQEEYNIPVILRITTRIAHSKTVVEMGNRSAPPDRGYVKDFTKTNLLPSNARPLHRSLEERLQRLVAYSSQTPLNRIEQGKPDVGIIADGVAYQYAREAFPEPSFLKLGMIHPLPLELIKRFAQGKTVLFVVEEVDPFVELQVKALGLTVTGKSRLPRCDELSPGVVRRALQVTASNPMPVTDIPLRPPALCPGCPHTGLFFLLQKRDLIVSGDIGCYTLGSYPPHNAMDSCVCMGASITLAHGIEKALGQTDRRRIVAVIGDSTFFHMGLPGLVNTVYNRGNSITIVVDNRTTGMTGHQEHPGTGKTLSGEVTKRLDVVEVVKGLGIEKVYVLDPYQVKENRKLMKSILKEPGPAVIVSQRECALRAPPGTPHTVLAEVCTTCKTCLALGCPAIGLSNGKVVIDELICFGCTMCAQLCPKNAIVEVGK